MLYFACGAHLDPELMREECPGHRIVGLASLAEHQLGFPRFSPRWGGGVASPHLAHGQTLWGVVYELTEADVQSLDQHQGWIGPGDQHNLCDRGLVTVELTRPDDSSIPRRVRALLYQARPYNPSPPTARYMDSVLRGARHHQLPEDYIAKLAAIPIESEQAAE